MALKKDVEKDEGEMVVQKEEEKVKEKKLVNKKEEKEVFAEALKVLTKETLS